MSSENNEVLIACTASKEFKKEVRIRAAQVEKTVSKYVKGLIEKDLEEAKK
ncbi:hypothetical protein [Ruegeria sp. HKCCD7318]|uniref:hypothetical protein n=1 Tax=Ruegeria sp. HKCCD7318 TaxID=2683014 RepID=UPI0014925589|nr:hypothetical protein [Ruegeria sp. HKCCD7318]NOE32317.1 hypothetical protein [Ruegeria sp. HKCCD7318]